MTTPSDAWTLIPATAFEFSVAMQRLSIGWPPSLEARMCSSVPGGMIRFTCGTFGSKLTHTA